MEDKELIVEIAFLRNRLANKFPNSVDKAEIDECIENFKNIVFRGK